MGSSYRTRLDAYIQPKGHRPYAMPARLDFRDKAEQKAQLTGYVRSKWPKARSIQIDLNSLEIIIDGQLVANFALHTPRENK